MAQINSKTAKTPTYENTPNTQLVSLLSAQIPFLSISKSKMAIAKSLSLLNHSM